MSGPRYILGVSMSNHDRSACLMADGEVAGAVAEERLDRRKRSEGFFRDDPRGAVVPPTRAITRLLRDAAIGFDDLELVVCGRSITGCRETLLDHLPLPPGRVVEPPLPSHHLAHAYSAYATSPHPETAVLVIDEQGHWVEGRFERATWFTGQVGPLRVLRRFWGSREDLSLGMFYNVFAALAGLSEGGRPAAGKLMSLASYGRPRPEWGELIHLESDGDAGCYLQNLDTFLATAGVTVHPGLTAWTVKELDDLLIKYQPVGWRSDLGRDLARKAQDELERAIRHTAAGIRSSSGLDVLAYAGGVALNCSSNARLASLGWRDVHVHPAATDDGAAIGLAAYGWIDVLDQPRKRQARFSPMTGPIHSATARTTALESYQLASHAKPDPEADAAAELIAGGAVVCWFSGRSEWGPRALGARSIVANPSHPGITERINSTIKFREPFRPFGISLLEEATSQVLEVRDAPGGLSPYMLSVGTALMPGIENVAHVDGSVRYQVVSKNDQPIWHALIEKVGAYTGLPAVLNTSFNTHGEPLVESPDDAVRQFLLSDADALWLDGELIEASQLPPDLRVRVHRIAWQSSQLDPLLMALGHEANGYVTAAAHVLGEHSVETTSVLGRGPEAMRIYHALQLRLANAKNDPAAAREHAESVLHWWFFPSEVMSAARTLSQGEPGSISTVTGQLLGSLGAGRSALAFFQQLVGLADVEESE